MPFCLQSMGNDQMPDEPKTFWGKLVVLTAFITVIAPLVGLLYEKGVITFPEWIEARKLNSDQRAREEEHRQEEQRKNRKEELEAYERKLLTFPLCCFDQIACWSPKRTT